MKIKLYKCLIIVSLALITFSCRNNDAEKNNIDEIILIKKLSENDFYKDFFHYQIRPRDEGRVYMVETDSMSEFLVYYDIDEGVTFYSNNEAYVERKLKKIYPNEYLKIKNNYTSDLNRLLHFMHDNEIKWAVHGTNEVDFDLSNGTRLKRNDLLIENKRIELLREHYDDVRVIDSNWVIFKNPKYESPKE